MENASKALIIAGAILLSILIISLGIMIYNQAAGVVNNNSMNEIEIAQFNQKFTQYEGTNVKGANVNSLFQAIVSNNISNQDDDSKQVGLTWNTSKAEKIVQMPTTRAQTGKTYTVSYTLDSKTGLVNEITVTDSTSTTKE